MDVDFRFSEYTIIWVMWILWGIGMYIHIFWTGRPYGTITWHVWWLFGVGQDERGQFVFSWGRVTLIAIMLVVTAVLTSHWAFGIPSMYIELFT